MLITIPLGSPKTWSAFGKHKRNQGSSDKATIKTNALMALVKSGVLNGGSAHYMSSLQAGPQAGEVRGEGHFCQVQGQTDVCLLQWLRGQDEELLGGVRRDLGECVQEAAEDTKTNTGSAVPVIVNEKNHGVCAPYATGLCIAEGASARLSSERPGKCFWKSTSPELTNLKGFFGKAASMAASCVHTPKSNTK